MKVSIDNWFAEMVDVLAHDLNVVSADYIVSSDLIYDGQGPLTGDNYVNGKRCIVREWRSNKPGNLVMQWAAANYIQGLLYTEDDTVTLLIPDRDRENREDFIWCVPIDRPKWNKWHEISITFKTVTPPEHGNMHYINRMEGRKVRTIMVLPHGAQSDDEVMAACAYLRLVRGMTCRMYVVRCSDDPPKGARLMERVIGVDPNLMDNVDEGDEAAGPPVDKDDIQVDDGTFVGQVLYVPDGVMIDAEDEDKYM